MISPRHSVTTTIEGNAIDIIYLGVLEIRAVITYHCATYSMWPGPLLIVLYLGFAAKTLNTPAKELPFQCSVRCHLAF